MIVGVDVSSRRIDLAWLDNEGKPRRWHQELAKGHLIDRLRSLRIQWPTTEPATINLEYGVTMTNPTWAPGHGITDVAIEYPFGRGNAIAALMATVGVITRQAPPWSRVAWPSAGELRAAIGAKNTKSSAHVIVCQILAGQIDYSWNEHELDALVACIGWTKILEAQE